MLSALALVCGCATFPVDDDRLAPPVEPDPDATCADACAHIGPEGLDCEQGRPTPDGATCTEVCEGALADGLDVHPECIVRVERCEHVDAASQGC